MAAPDLNGSFEEGSLPKKFKVNGNAVNGDGSSSNGGVGITYSEADSSNDVGSSSSQFPSYGPASNSQDGDDLLPSYPAWQLSADPTDYPSDSNEASTSSGSRGEPLKHMLDCVEHQYVDERTSKQMLDIENEIKLNVPFVAEKEDLSVLGDEYSDPVYIAKIMDLKSKYQWLRRTRGDGNCFYRSLGFSMFENFMRAGDKEKVEAMKRFMVECKDGLVELKYPALAIEDFMDVFNDQLTKVMETPTDEELLRIFQEQGSSDFIVVWLRFLTVLQLRREPEFYQNFIENHSSVVEFCQMEVEPMYKESDHIHIIAVASLLKIKIRVEYMDRGDSPTVIGHDFPEDDAVPEIYLLYRPGHYDILYRKDSD
ncbi:Ubiquitin thioesterase otubain-like [Hypsibius exemplaris]|uniref:ubiquitinyl hydrolase 1 n=1 Tax=Hypsibius exemplaris TaxID=2072580 RepID=A0A1W0WSM5_HYPEX|nr:Ubiquitin thioesterase otubain-like [Hypsibius exemplaris]